VLNAGARADDGVLPNNPYAPIVVRNVFGLNPPLPADASQSADPPPKITPNGIMSIFGHLQVLFKVAPKAGQPGAKEESYILSEGQRQDEIEVIQIDEKNSLVTFNNHGTVQELPLAKANAPAVNTPVATQGRPFPTPNSAAPNGENNGRIPVRFGGRSAGGPGAAQNRGMGDGTPLTTAPTSRIYNPASQPNQMTAEQTAAIIELQRLAYQSENNPLAKILPPTKLTPRNSGAVNNPGGMSSTP
jgi:hypothetical protein